MSRNTIFKSVKTWIFLGIIGVALVGCSAILPDFESDFISDDTVARETVHADVAGGIELSYLRAGDPNGQRVIFVHGTPGDAGGNWVGMLRQVPPGFEFIAVDRPGFGLTKPKKQLVRLNDQAAALAPLLIERNGKKTILAGHSLGGPIVATAAANYPDKVGAIMVLAGALDPDLEEVLFIQHVGNFPLISWMLPTAARHSNKELIALEDELRILDKNLPGIKQPVTIVHGTVDKLVPYENVPFMERRLTGTPLLHIVTIENMNHFLQWRQQAVIMDAVMTTAEMMEASIGDTPRTITRLNVDYTPPAPKD